MSPPTAISGDLLSLGSYTFTIFLCNFLGGCSQGSRSVLVLATQVPITTISGQPLRYVKRQNALQLTSDSYIAGCNGASAVSTGISRSWKVYINNVETFLVKSSSIDNTAFQISAFSLEVNVLYKIEFTAFSIASSQSSKTYVEVFVQAASVVAVIVGSSSQGLKIGDSLTVDGSNSYDEDVDGLVGVDAGLLYTWSCIQSEPTLSNTCPLTGISDNGDAHDVVTVTPAADDATAVLTMTVTSGTRSSSASITIIILALDAPSLSITTTILKKQSTLAKLKLSAEITTNAVSELTWSTNDPSIDLATSSLTPITQTFETVGTYTVNFVLSANVLTERTTFTFSLACVVQLASSVQTTTVSIEVLLGCPLGWLVG
jgi:hypothetical protein